MGVVIGATLNQVPDLSALDGPVLVPGIGAQGGRPEALAGLGARQLVGGRGPVVRGAAVHILVVEVVRQLLDKGITVEAMLAL